MDVSELRQGILRALDQARRDASVKRTVIDEATEAYDEFLKTVAVPLARQAVTVLRAERQQFSVHTPADAVRVVSDASPHTYLELSFDTSGEAPQVLGRVSVTRGRQGHVIEETRIGDGRAIAELADQDVAEFLLAAIPKLVVKR